MAGIRHGKGPLFMPGGFGPSGKESVGGRSDHQHFRSGPAHHCRAFEEAGRPVENLLFIAHDIERILLMMEPADQVERIYINFCNPWPTGSHHKKRLTHPRQLEKYKTFLPVDGHIHFKTDDDTLFDQSCRYFSDSGFALEAITRDLHRSPFQEESWETEHEAMFSKEGIPIKFLIAVRSA